MKHLTFPQRTISFFAALISCITLSLTSCEKEEVIMDYVPVRIFINIHDAAGNDLLAPTAENSLRGELTVTYGGETYTVEKEPQRSSRAYLAQLTEPYIKPGEKGYTLVLGEWAGNGRYDNEQAVLNWPDGTHTTISFTLQKNGWTHAKFYLDGQKNASNEFDLVYPRK